MDGRWGLLWGSLDRREVEVAVISSEVDEQDVERRVDSLVKG